MKRIINDKETSKMRIGPKWLESAIFYEIYPQSFKDTDGDGIGNINGITEELPYIHDLGCNAIWLNPCFESPFGDAGYDVSDYYKVAARYGTNDDIIKIILVVINPTDMPYDLKTDLSMQEIIYSIGDKPDLREGRCIIKERSASLWVVK